MSGSIRHPVPRATIHKRILDSAAEDHSRSVIELADEISGATVGLVESVLTEYGDPAGSSSERSTPHSRATGTTQRSDEAGDGPREDCDAEHTDDVSRSGTERSDRKPAMSLDEGDGGPATGAVVADTFTVTNASRSARSERSCVDDSSETDGTERVDGSCASTEAETNGKRTAETGTSTETDSAEADSAPLNDDPVNDEDNRSQEGSLPAVEELTPEQLETLAAIRDRPEATQSELADELGVSRAAVSVRANSVPGMEWRSRARFVSKFFATFDGLRADDAKRTLARNRLIAGGETTIPDGGETDPPTEPTPAYETRLRNLEEDLSRALARIEQVAGGVEGVGPGRTAATDEPSQVETNGRPTGAPTRLDPELAHKLLRYCLEDDRFDKDEERQLVAAFLGH